jgi:hypothetical protein
MRGEGRALASVLSAFLAVSTAGAETDPSQMRSELSRSRYEAAILLQERGEGDEARKMLEEAVELDGRSSDALYALSLAIPPGRRKDSLLERAVASGNWQGRSADEAAVDLAETFIRRREYAKAEALLRGRGRDGPRFALALCRAAFFAGKRAIYESRLDEAVSSYPDDQRIIRFWIERAEPALAFDAKILKRLGPRIGEAALADGEIRIHWARLRAGSEEGLDILKAALASGEKSRLAIAAYAARGLMDGVSAVVSFFGLHPSNPTYGEIESLAKALAPGEGKTALGKRLSSYSGLIAEDREGDGFPESSVTYLNGELQSAALDSDQDGEADRSARFIDGLPMTVEMKDAGGGIRFIYARYPEIKAVEYDRVDFKRSYDLKAGGLSLPVISYAFPFRADGVEMRKPIFQDGALEPSEEGVMRAAVRSVQDGPGLGADRLLVHTELRDGFPLREESYRGSVLVETIDFISGKPLRGDRDSDGDGRLETRVEYPASVQGSLAEDPRAEYRIDIDADGDGVYEYREEGLPFRVKSWDYDGDGLFDAREERGAKGRILRSFSSRLDGKMDVRVEFASGIPVSVTRGALSLKMVKEKGHPSYWIGEKPFDLGDALPAKDGIHAFKGRRFLLFRVDGAAMLEALP